MVDIFFFGKQTKRRVTKKRSVKKPPAKILRLCKKYKIKVTMKRGSKRVYKSLKVLKKQIAKAKKKHRRGRKVSPRKRKVTRRRFAFGNAAPFTKSENFGYNEAVKINQGSLPQSISIVTSENNSARPEGFQLDSDSVPTFGTYAPFFGQQVPRVIGPNSIGFMGQPDGSMMPVGAPFERYTTPAFGKRRAVRRRRSRMY